MCLAGWWNPESIREHAGLKILFAAMQALGFDELNVFTRVVESRKHSGTLRT
jgi:hypothetical protein